MALKTDEFGDSFSGSDVASLTLLFAITCFSTTTEGFSLFLSSVFSTVPKVGSCSSFDS